MSPLSKLDILNKLDSIDSQTDLNFIALPETNENNNS